MKNVDILTEQKSCAGCSSDSSSGVGREKTEMLVGSKSEKGVVLVVVLVLSAVVLALMTALIYMITTGTQVSGLQKRHKTAIEAGSGGADLFYQLIALRGETSGQQAFVDNLNTAGLYFTSSPGTCSAATYSGLAAKLLAPSTAWVGCDKALTINTANPLTYDMKIQLGTTVKYNVYAKIVATSVGNTGGDSGLMTRGVVSANSGEVAVAPMPFLYAIETVSENSANTAERAKFSILYQY
jgi:hypothetical protein